MAVIVAAAMYFQEPRPDPLLKHAGPTPGIHQSTKASHPDAVLGSEPESGPASSTKKPDPTISLPTITPHTQQPSRSMPTAMPVTAPPPGYILGLALQDMMIAAPRDPVPSPTARPTRKVPPTTASVVAIPPTLVPIIVVSRPTPTATPTPTVRPTPTPTLTYVEKLAQWRAYLLNLLNGSREKAELSAVTLGNNEAAQKHVEAMLEHGFAGHRGLDGLMPHMRYTLAGGTNGVSENTSGFIGIKEADWGPQYRKRGWRESLNKVHQGFLNSSGHRKTVLDKWHRKVSLGIACNAYTCSVVQNFEGGYVEFTSPPNISRAGVLTFAGKFEGGFTMSNVQVWHHQTPHDLTLGQLDATYSYNVWQEPATFIIEPAPPGTYYSVTNLLPSSYTWSSGVDPYSISPKAPRNSSSALGLPRIILPPMYMQKDVPWTVASRWSQGPSFDVKADIRKVVSDMGPGVYIIVIWGKSNGEAIRLTNYAVFID